MSFVFCLSFFMFRFDSRLPGWCVAVLAVCGCDLPGSVRRRASGGVNGCVAWRAEMGIRESDGMNRMIFVG